MKLEQSFEVAAPLQSVWEALVDVERVAPCLPGAAVTARNDDGSYDGEFRVKIGPTSAAYAGRLTVDGVDEAAHVATMHAAGTDKRGQGGAKATIVSEARAAGDGRTAVDVSSDYHITGRLARFGRGGMIEEISAQLLIEFAANLQAMLDDAGAGDPAAAAPTAAAVPPGDPDGAIEGAMPVADSLADEPATPAPPPDAPAPPPATATGFDGPDPEPAPALSPAGSVVVRRVRENPVPLAALLAGFLVALRVLRRRS